MEKPDRSDSENSLSDFEPPISDVEKADPEMKSDPKLACNKVKGCEGGAAVS